jgi:hypothetical protein
MLAFAFFSLVLLLVVGGLVYRRAATTQNVVAMVQSLLTAAAILLAGFWYFIERKGMAHAEMHLAATGVHVADGIALVQLRIETKNVGYIMLRAEQWDVRLLSVVPTRLPLEKLVRLKVTPWPERFANADTYYDQELGWQPLRAFQGADRHDIEPGESDLKALDFVVPCTLQAGEFTAALRKRDAGWDWDRFKKKLLTGEQEEMWWKDRLLFSLKELCASPMGSVVRLGDSPTQAATK